MKDKNGAPPKAGFRRFASFLALGTALATLPWTACAEGDGNPYAYLERWQAHVSGTATCATFELRYKYWRMAEQREVVAVDYSQLVAALNDPSVDTDELEALTETLKPLNEAERAQCGDTVGSTEVDLLGVFNAAFAAARDQGRTEEEALAVGESASADAVRYAADPVLESLAGFHGIPWRKLILAEPFAFKPLHGNALRLIVNAHDSRNGLPSIWENYFATGDNCESKCGPKPRGTSAWQKAKLIAFLLCCLWDGSDPPQQPPREPPVLPPRVRPEDPPRPNSPPGIFGQD